MNDVQPSVEEFIKGLDHDDVARLAKLLAALRRVDGWCSVNRAIAKWLIFTAIAAIVLMSSGYDTLVRLISFLRGH